MVRVDMTLSGFETLSWQRGHQTFLYQGTRKDLWVGLVGGAGVCGVDCKLVMFHVSGTGHRVWDINHNERTVWEREFPPAAEYVLKSHHVIRRHHVTVM